MEDKMETNDQLTYFELLTICGFQYFKQKNCDYAIIETGLGGTYDCTNIIENPMVTVITSISKDHIKVLGF